MAFSCKTSLAKGPALPTVAARKPVVAARAAPLVCSAAKDSPAPKIAAAVALSTVLALSAVEPAKADIAGLTPCSKSKAFAKLQKKEIKGLEKRLKKYEAGSAPALALQATIDRTNARFAHYGEQGLLCGTDGLPHLIADPGLALKFGHAGEIFIPTLGFLYVAGWIGNVGRNYLNEKKSVKKPTEAEIIIDVPLALSLAFQGVGWPAQVIAEMKAGTLTEKAENITVSPR